MTAAAREVVGPEPVDWRLAERVARGIAGRDRFADSYLAASLHTDFAAVEHPGRGRGRRVHRASAAPDRPSPRSSTAPGGSPPTSARCARCSQPLTDRFAERLAHNPLAPVGRRVAGTELGVLLGYVAQRVLGQYDLLVPDDDGGATADRVYYVGPTCSGSRSATRSGRATSGSGSRCTR